MYYSPQEVPLSVDKPTFSKYHFYDVTYEKFFSEEEKVLQNES